MILRPKKGNQHTLEYTYVNMVHRMYTCVDIAHREHHRRYTCVDMAQEDPRGYTFDDNAHRG